MRRFARRLAVLLALPFTFALLNVAPAHASTWTYMYNQQWGNAYGKCATPQGNSTANGAVITLWDCNGADVQMWVWDGNQIRNKASNKCLTPRGDAYNSNGAVLTLWTCNNATSQQWFKQSDGGPMILSLYGDNKCITNYGGNFGNGTWLTLWTCDWSHPSEQYWALGV